MAFLVTLIAASALAPVTSSSAAETKLTANVTFATHTITITAAPSVNLDIHARPEGTMTVAASTVNLSTTSPNGYSLYLGMNSDTSDLLISGTDYSTRLKASSGTFTSPVTMENEDSTWGYAISSTAATIAKPNGFDANYTTGEDLSVTANKFASIPSNENPPQLIAKSDNASASSGDSLSVYYAVRASYDTTPGAYSNQVIYSAISDGGSGHDMVVNPSQTSNIAGGDELDVITSLYGTVGSIEGKVYMLTATEYNAVNTGTPVTNYSTKAMSCTRDTSSDTLKYTCIAPSNPIGSYYVYVDVPEYAEHYEKAFSYVQATFWNISTMQQMTPALCASATTPSASATIADTTGAFAGNTSYVPQRTLYDIRDRNSYTIAKLPDGNCWMTQNLALAPTTNTNLVLTPSDSNVSSDFTFPSSAIETGTNAWTADTLHVYIQSGSDSTNGAPYGNLYNWYTATAGTGLSTKAKDATQDICPKGWRLPDGGQSEAGSFYELDIALGGTGEDRYPDTESLNKFRLSPYLFPYSGRYSDDGGLLYQGSRGIWWSRNAYTSAGSAYLFALNSNGAVRLQASSIVRRGFSIRCIASNQDFWSISTMQEMTPEIVSSVVTPSTTAASAVTNATDYANTYDKTSVVPERVLTDTRDGETYRVRKLADGNVWMTENLRLTLTEGQAIEISDGSMWLPTNYDGTTTNSATLTWEDIDDDIWYTVSVGADGASIVRSYDTAGSSGKNYCYRTAPESGSGLRPHGTEPCVETYDTYDGETQPIGVYYNWYTATAGQGTFDMGEEATISICPKNWELPSLNIGSPAFSEIYETYGGAVDVVKAFPISFITTGEFGADYGSPLQYTSYGFFMTKTPEYRSTDNYPSDMNRGFVSSTGFRVSTIYQTRKRNGLTIRCAISGL